MRADLNQFLNLQKALQNEKSRLEARLNDITGCSVGMLW